MQQGKHILRRQGRYCNFFFVKPRSVSNAHQAARKLMRIENVQEVMITEGDYGFIVRTKPAVEREWEKVNKEISRVVGGNTNKAVCYCQYSK